jgi:DNA-binding transcriptional MerR regulator
MFTVSALARRCGVSRSTVLYYESVGLLAGARRTASNYRVYGECDLQRLERIRAYRDAGLELSDIQVLLDAPGTDAAGVLTRRLLALDAEIARLREHQRAIAQLLPSAGAIEGDEMMMKDKWVTVMQAAGFSDDDMHRWHAEFERAAPTEHEEFLQFLHVPADEIRQIREWSATYGKK